MRRNLWLAAVLLLLLSGSAFAQKRSITEKDLFSFVWVGDTQISPDGNRAVFVQTTVNTKHDGYATALYLLDLTQPGAKPRQLTNGPHDSQPRWSPDGGQIAFVRAIEKDGKPQPGQVYVLPMSGGEPMPLVSLTKGASSPQWSPDGKSITVLSEVSIVPEKPGDETTKPEDKPNDDAKDDKTAKPKADEHKSDVRIITKAVYRFNGEGYLDPKLAPQLFLYTIPAPSQPVSPPTQLTSDRYGIDEYLWDPTGRRIYYSSEHTDEPYYDLPHNELYQISTVAAAGKVPAKQPGALVAKFTFNAYGLSLSPDTKHLAFHAEEHTSPPRSHQQTDLFILDIDPTQPAPARLSLHNLTADYDCEMGSGVGGETPRPEAGDPACQMVARWKVADRRGREAGKRHPRFSECSERRRRRIHRR